MLVICLKIMLLAFVLAPLIAGCVHEVNYVSGKYHRYDIAAFTPTRITSASWVDPEDHHTAVYTSNPLTPMQKERGSFRGSLYIRTSNEADAKSWVVNVRREQRSTFAEAPLAEPIKIGKKKIFPSFVMGRHKDHKEMAGVYFRMAF